MTRLDYAAIAAVVVICAAFLVFVGSLIVNDDTSHLQFPQAIVTQDRSCAGSRCVSLLPGHVLRFSDRDGNNVVATYVGRCCR